jgi:DNA-binding MarR family transcriptional regulator
MDPFFFSMKRGYYASLRYSWKVLKGSGVTPARLDVLRCILDARGHELPQADLVRMLGVARSTMSRMVGALVRAGLVTRQRADYDGRVWLCAVTDKATRIVEDILERWVDSRVVARTIDQALLPFARRLQRFARIVAVRLCKAFVGRSFGLWYAYWGDDDYKPWRLPVSHHWRRSLLLQHETSYLAL